MKDHLFSLNADPLKAIARTLGCLEKGATSKGAAANAVETAVRLRPQEFLAALTDIERKYFSECIHAEIPSDWMFEAKYGGPAPKTSGYWGHNEKPGPLVAVIHHERGYPPALVPGITEIYRKLVEVPSPPTASTLSAPPEKFEDRPVHVFSGEADAPAQVARVLRLIQSGKIKVADSTGRPTDASARALSGVLLQPDFDLECPEHARGPWEQDTAGPVRAHAWGVLAQQCGWAKVKAGALVLTDAGKAILEKFTPERYREGVTAFLEDEKFDELNRVNHIRGQSGKSKRWMTSPSDRKVEFSETVENWPVGGWMTFSEAVRIIAASGGGPEIIASGATLYICDAQYGEVWDSSDLSIQFLRALIMEPLATLGLVDIAFVYPHDLWPELGDSYGRDSHSFLGRYDGLLSVRLNPLGAWCFEVAESYSLPAVETMPLFRVLPNHEIVATSPPDPASAAFVDLFAVRKSEAVWAFDAEKILTFIEGGGSMDELRSFLAAHSAGGIPGNVEVWLDGLLRKSGSCRRAQKAVIFEWEDPAQAALLASSSETSRLCHHAGDNRIAVPAAKLPAFTRAARRMGYILPAGS
jgi:hypothetical protein